MFDKCYQLLYKKVNYHTNTYIRLDVLIWALAPIIHTESWLYTDMHAWLISAVIAQYIKTSVYVEIKHNGLHLELLL